MFETTQATKEKTCQVKGHVASTLGTSYEKPHKNDEVGKYEARYDVVQEEYDFGVGSILEQLKQKLLNYLELCNKRPVRLLKMFKKKLEKQKRTLVQL